MSFRGQGRVHASGTFCDGEEADDYRRLRPGYKTKMGRKTHIPYGRSFADADSQLRWAISASEEVTGTGRGRGRELDTHCAFISARSPCPIEVSTPWRAVRLDVSAAVVSVAGFRAAWAPWSFFHQAWKPCNSTGQRRRVMLPGEE